MASGIRVHALVSEMRLPACAEWTEGGVTVSLPLQPSLALCLYSHPTPAPAETMNTSLEEPGRYQEPLVQNCIWSVWFKNSHLFE